MRDNVTEGSPPPLFPRLCADNGEIENALQWARWLCSQTVIPAGAGRWGGGGGGAEARDFVTNIVMVSESWDSSCDKSQVPVQNH